MDAKYDVPWGAKASWIFFHCSAGWRGNFCAPLIHRKYRCGLKVLGLSKVSAKRTMYLKSSMFKSIQKLAFFHVPSSNSLDIAYTAYPHITVHIWKVGIFRCDLLSQLLLEVCWNPWLCELWPYFCWKLRHWNCSLFAPGAWRKHDLAYRHIYTYRQLHSFSSHLNATKNQLAFFAPPAFINPFMVHFQLGFFLLLCMSQKYFCFRCSNVTKEKKCNGGYLMSSILVFVLSIMDVQRGWGLVREGMASLCVGQPFFFQQMLIL